MLFLIDEFKVGVWSRYCYGKCFDDDIFGESKVLD